MENHSDIEKEEKEKLPWIQRLGWAAFLFFFVKGLIWLAVFFGLFKMCN
jgi:hypothetical protein